MPLFANLDSAGIYIIRVDGHHLPKLDSGRGLQQQIRQDTQAKKYKTEQLWTWLFAHLLRDLVTINSQNIVLEMN